ncbi:MAG: hypothetical protein ACFB13_16470 [Kiloniellaceae bacterium]
MFQQSATPENLGPVSTPAAPKTAAPLGQIQGPNQPQAQAQAPSPTQPGRDAFLDHYFKRIDPDVAASFTEDQCEAIKAMFGARGIVKHSVEVRRSLPIGRGRYYLVLLLGRERRTFGRLYSEGGVSSGFNFLGYAITAALWMLPAVGTALLLQALL